MVAWHLLRVAVRRVCTTLGAWLRSPDAYPIVLGATSNPNPESHLPQQAPLLRAPHHGERP